MWVDGFLVPTNECVCVLIQSCRLACEGDKVEIVQWLAPNGLTAHTRLKLLPNWHASFFYLLTRALIQRVIVVFPCVCLSVC